MTQLWAKPELGRNNLSGQVAKAGASGRIVIAGDATFVLDPVLHNDRIVLLDRAAGIAATLPQATGSGVKFTILVKTTFSGSSTIKVQNSTDVFRGIVFQTADGGTTLAAYEAAGTDDTITMNGTSTGGIVGDRYEFIDYAPGFWNLMAWTSATGSEGTPLSATV